jgi:homocysteine S-methyltransferase
VAFHKARLTALLIPPSAATAPAPTAAAASSTSPVLPSHALDLFAFETIPTRLEAQALIEVCEWLQTLPQAAGLGVWISFACRDGAHVSSGHALQECVQLFAQAMTRTATSATAAKPLANVVALGVNCTAPKYVAECIQVVNQTLDKFWPSAAASTSALTTTTPVRPLIICYPNSGELWDSNTRSWHTPATIKPPSASASTSAAPSKSAEPEAASKEHLLQEWAQLVPEWNSLGASIIGGCCRTDGSHLAVIRKALTAPASAAPSKSPVQTKNS